MQEDMRRTAGPLVSAHSHGIKVEIEEHCKRDMFGWCRAANSEVSGMGLVRLIDGVFRVYKVFLPEQECSSGYTQFSSEALGRLNYYLFKNKLPMSELRFWWHTHFTFGTFWSGTDDNTAQQLAHGNGEWSLSLVINQAGDFLARTDIVKPIPVMVDKLSVSWVPDSIKRSHRNYKSDIRKWVKPLPSRQYAVWSPKSVVKLHKEELFTDEEYIIDKKDYKSTYITYAGRVMTLVQFTAIMNCTCSDNDCSDCQEILGAKHEAA